MHGLQWVDTDFTEGVNRIWTVFTQGLNRVCKGCHVLYTGFTVSLLRVYTGLIHVWTGFTQSLNRVYVSIRCLVDWFFHFVQHVQRHFWAVNWTWRPLRLFLQHFPWAMPLYLLDWEAQSRWWVDRGVLYLGICIVNTSVGVYCFCFLCAQCFDCDSYKTFSCKYLLTQNNIRNNHSFVPHTLDHQYLGAPHI